MIKKNLFIVFAFLIIFCLTFEMSDQLYAQAPYQPSWNSLKKHTTPQWLKDGKFGIYTHWGIYAVPAQGPNCTWYAHNFYMEPDGPERKYQEATYGRLINLVIKISSRCLLPRNSMLMNGQICSRNQEPGLQGLWPSITTDSPCGTRSGMSITQPGWDPNGMSSANSRRQLKSVA